MSYEWFSHRTINLLFCFVDVSNLFYFFNFFFFYMETKILILFKKHVSKQMHQNNLNL